VTKCNRSDEQLIDQFLTGARDDAENAFEVLVKRHGPMVLRVCRHILSQHQDAEDALQATFMSLARKAGTIRDRTLLACWLHEVAYRFAIRMRARVSRLPALTGTADRETSGGEAEIAAARKELGLLVHAEVDRLPKRYRSIVVHSYLEGETNQEVARRLNCPVGTIKGQLSRARELLRRRLSCTELDPDHTIEFDSSRTRGMPPDYRAGQRMTGGPIGVDPASARFRTGSSVTWT
jgi:RNA polymerase sigma factor (sigma-70 family)